jgi:hypothetical protein
MVACRSLRYLSVTVFSGLTLALTASSAHGALGDLLRTYTSPSASPAGEYADVGLSLDVYGTNILAGAPGDGPGWIYPGSVYLFDTQTGGVIRKFNNPSQDTTSTGYANAVCAVGSRVLVGASEYTTTVDLSGKAFLFNGSTGSLDRTLAAGTPTCGAQYGKSVAAYGPYALVGAPYADATANINDWTGKVYMYDPQDGTLLRTFNNPAPAYDDKFGFAVAGMGSNVLISAPGDKSGATRGGMVYLYNGQTGAQLRTFADPTPSTGEWFGCSIASAGNTVFVGSPFGGYGAVHAYAADTGEYLQTYQNPRTVSDAFGCSIAVVGRYLLIGADGRGALTGKAYLFDVKTGDLVHTFTDPSPAANDVFGWAVAAIGSDYLISDPYQDVGGLMSKGAVYLFEGIHQPGLVSSSDFGQGLAGWRISGGGTGKLVEDPRAAGNWAVEMATGSPVTLGQSVDTPAQAFWVEFDYEFTKTDGFLTISLAGQVLDTLYAPAVLAGDWTSYKLLVNDPALIGLANATLELTLNAAMVSQIRLDNISLTEIPEPSTLAMLILSSLVWAGRKRRR